MSTAYGDIKSPVVSPSALSWLPERAVLEKSGKSVTFGRLQREDTPSIVAVRDILNGEISAGTSYPQETVLDTAAFVAYFLSHDAFVVRDAADENKILGAFYVKPNFPGRCSHICNGGFVVDPKSRSAGVGRFMAKRYLIVAKQLGYRASFFNLVFGSNKPALALWRSAGFRETGVIPNAVRLPDGTFANAHQFFFDLTAL